MGDHSTSSSGTPVNSHPPPPTVQDFQEPFIAPNSRPAASRSPSRSNDDASARAQPRGTRSRANSRPVVHQPQQPIKDVVNTAFDNSSTANELDPAFMKRLTEQVTEQVIKTLQSSNIAIPPSPAIFPIDVPLRSPSQSSPMQHSTDSFPPRFTPPSPLHDRDAGLGPSNERAPSDAGSNYSRRSWESEESRESQQSTQSSKETPRASHVGAPPRRSKTIGSTSTGEPALHTNKSQSRRRDSGADATARVREAAAYFNDASQRTQRPASVPEDEETTTLEKIWQPLFDGTGSPTKRLGQFLRGLAKHLIEDYEPKGSLVVTPPKMLQFLNETKTAKEYYPWDVIFGGKLSSASISIMYRKMLCQHHLVQQQPQEPPSTPGLTPVGFEAFMTCVIQAHPDTEFERLAKAVQNMPISNADDKSERFPKELPRRLLPRQPNVQAEQRLISSLNHEPVHVPLQRGAFAMPPPPPVPPLQSLFVERERNPYSQASQQSNAFDDEDISPPAVPIERERKPYFGKEGMGKKYEAGDERDSRDYNRPATSQYRPEASGSRSSRANNPASSALPTEYSSIPSSTRSHRMSIGAHSGAGGKSSRRSPPRGGFARSDPIDVGAIPPSQYASNLYGTSFGARDRFTEDLDDDVARPHNVRRPADRHASATEDEYSNSRPIPPRNNPPPNPSGYDSAYASGGPPPPNGNFPHRNSGSAQEGERRRSWYQSMPPGSGSMAPGGGGSDGYGSYAGNGPMYGASGH
ncbi:unnamed protein product [Zymoseptoria tritici ST99CH_1A5]|uniref:DUF7514 domain-containing protein n=4 Tax=Zymoseptoria tritici TaxID=1047171 RepID=F9XA72_ZYMTI|nr:uncharacterized protein MYCGRDRAFT_109112 [Zymoseptoria tritici IPO323]SMQ49928.1 unnamed protein product [Zymoseptoria tritici ST99CH_3D7]SMR50916.1 unnamed protein product [Zymoseptoria tritici ST99CH_1E4]SMR51856.1 unnamed protein product [Zymoseptoria tritici ST99CH_3D1]SMY23610.1 unnamed protein product [Zymoseptoria tritici ST99CH_1A5]EGP88396.1 hypothetical protein MYCGRDRAFT_109112 [Zymoseptoria tritici IPO323]